MRAGSRSAATLAGLCLLMLVATVWGWNALTQPFPKNTPPPDCVQTKIAAGERVFPEQVVISLFNASTRSGLASATSADLSDRGFVIAESGNAPSKSVPTQILTSDPQNPAVRLVQGQFKGAQIVPGDSLRPGVTVLVGEAFAGLRVKGVKSVAAATDAVICAAPGA